MMREIRILNGPPDSLRASGFNPPPDQSVASRQKIAAATQSVPALEKALSILEMLASSQKGLLLPEIVKKSGMPKSSVDRKSVV